MEELISIGTIGLIKAVDTFDHEKASKLATYAARCVENEILMYLRAKKKYMRESSYYEPIGTDKEGNEIQLLDVIESGAPEALEQIGLKDDTAKMYRLLEEVLTPRERTGADYEVWTLSRKGIYTTGNCPKTRNFQILYQPD